MQARNLLVGLAVFSAVVSGATAQEFRRFHFKKPVEMRLDPSRLAIRSDGAARAIAGYREKPGSFQYPLPQWKLVENEDGNADAKAVRSAIGAITRGGQVDFVSPVFVDDFGGPTVVTQDILVGVRETIPAVAARAIVARFGAVIEEGVGGLPNGFKVRSHSRNGAEVLEQANELAQLDEVEFAEPDMIVTTRSGLIPNDAFFGNSWGLRNTGQNGGMPGFDMGATTAWDTTTGASAIWTVVLDTGIQSNHPDLSGRIVTPGFDATGQGGLGEPVNVCDNHGTPVAGCIVSRINNSLGTTGIAPNSRVISARITVSNVPCDNNGSAQLSWFADALSWAQGLGVRVSNTSQSIGTTSSIIDAAYASTYNAGMIHFASAANNGTGTVSYPANLGVVNAVAALNRFGNRAWFSNWGTGLDFSAPGQEIYTTDRTGAAGDDPGNYRYANGTSFASPYAAGVAALILSKKPGLLPSQVEAIMRGTARDLGNTGYDTDFGHGLVHADGAIRAVNGDCPLTWEEEFDGFLPVARAEHAFAFDTSRNSLILFGGNISGSLSGETWEYANGYWRLASTTGPSARKNAMMVYDSVRQRAVLFGGFNSGGVLGDTWEWNGAAWSQPNLTGATPPARRTASMCFDSQRGRVVLHGGLTDSGGILGGTWEFDGTSWVYLDVSSPAPARYGSAMAFDATRNVCVLFGGLGLNGYVNDTWEWNGVNWVPRAVLTSPSARAGHTSMAFDAGRGRCVLFGGEASGGVVPGDCWEFDGTNWQQRLVALPLSRYGNAVAFDSANHRIMLFGGAADTNNVGTKFADLWAFDGGSWVPVAGPGPSARFGSGLAYSPHLGGAVMFGGQIGFAQPLSPRSNELWLQSPTGWGRLNSFGPPKRVYPSLGSLENGDLVMFGGLGEFDDGQSDLWRHSNGAWSFLNPAGSPAARWGATSCVFTSTNKFVVFGGQFNGSLVSNTLSVIDLDDPQQWQHYPGSGGPSARDYAMMAYDPVNDEAILFGGRASGGWALDDVWRLRFVAGTPEWTQVSSLGSINGWDSGSMFWDPGRQRILLYGKQQFGFEPGAGVEPTVYEWMGTQFVPIALGAPPSLRRNAMMGPTSESGEIRLFGGLRLSDSAILSDTWEFNGVAAPAFPVGASGQGSFESGSTVTLHVPLVVGASPDLRWKLNGDPLFNGATPWGSVVSGATTDTLVISNIRPADAGMYSCAATNPCGSAETDSVLVEVTVGCPADFNGDELVDDLDFVLFASAYDILDCADPNMAPGCPADINSDGLVDDLDFVLFASAYDQLICP